MTREVKALQRDGLTSFLSQSTRPTTRSTAANLASTSSSFPVWDAALNKYIHDENTPHPFQLKDGTFSYELNPSHSSYSLFKTKEFKDCGFYSIHPSFLGYKPSEKPKFLLLNSSKASTTGFSFLKASKTKSDPDT